MSFNDREEVDAFLRYMNAGMGYLGSLEKVAGNPVPSIREEIGATLREYRREGRGVRGGEATNQGIFKPPVESRLNGKSPKKDGRPSESAEEVSASSAAKQGPSLTRRILNIPLRTLYAAGPGVGAGTARWMMWAPWLLSHSLPKSSKVRRGFDYFYDKASGFETGIPDRAFNTGSKILNWAADNVGFLGGVLGGGAAADYLLGEGNPVTDYYNASNYLFSNFTPLGWGLRLLPQPGMEKGGAVQKSSSFLVDFIGAAVDKVQELGGAAVDKVQELGGAAVDKARQYMDWGPETLPKKLEEHGQNLKEAATGVKDAVVDEATDFGIGYGGRVALKVMSYFMDKDGNFDPSIWRRFVSNPKNRELANDIWPLITNFISRGAIGTSAGMVNSLYKLSWLPNSITKSYISPFLQSQSIDGLVKKYKEYYPEYYQEHPEAEKQLRERLAKDYAAQAEAGIDLKNVGTLDNSSLALGLGLVSLLGGGAMMLFGGNNGGGGNAVAQAGGNGGRGNFMDRATANAQRMVEANNAGRYEFNAPSSYRDYLVSTAAPGGGYPAYWQNAGTNLGPNALQSSAYLGQRAYTTPTAEKDYTPKAFGPSINGAGRVGSA